jgi:hypothetical protein
VVVGLAISASISFSELCGIRASLTATHAIVLAASASKPGVQCPLLIAFKWSLINPECNGSGHIFIAPEIHEEDWVLFLGFFFGL